MAGAVAEETFKDKANAFAVKMREVIMPVTKKWGIVTKKTQNLKSIATSLNEFYLAVAVPISEMQQYSDSLKPPTFAHFLETLEKIQEQYVVDIPSDQYQEYRSLFTDIRVRYKNYQRQVELSNLVKCADPLISQYVRTLHLAHERSQIHAAAAVADDDIHSHGSGGGGHPVPVRTVATSTGTAAQQKAFADMLSSLGQGEALERKKAQVAKNLKSFEDFLRARMATPAECQRALAYLQSNEGIQSLATETGYKNFLKQNAQGLYEAAMLAAGDPDAIARRQAKTAAEAAQTRRIKLRLGDVPSNYHCPVQNLRPEYRTRDGRDSYSDESPGWWAREKETGYFSDQAEKAPNAKLRLLALYALIPIDWKIPDVQEAALYKECFLLIIHWREMLDGPGSVPFTNDDLPKTLDELEEYARESMDLRAAAAGAAAVGVSGRPVAVSDASSSSGSGGAVEEKPHTRGVGVGLVEVDGFGGGGGGGSGGGGSGGGGGGSSVPVSASTIAAMPKTAGLPTWLAPALEALSEDELKHVCENLKQIREWVVEAATPAAGADEEKPAAPGRAAEVMGAMPFHAEGAEGVEKGAHVPEMTPVFQKIFVLAYLNNPWNFLQEMKSAEEMEKAGTWARIKSKKLAAADGFTSLQERADWVWKLGGAYSKLLQVRVGILTPALQTFFGGISPLRSWQLREIEKRFKWIQDYIKKHSEPDDQVSPVAECLPVIIQDVSKWLDDREWEASFKNTITTVLQQKRQKLLNDKYKELFQQEAPVSVMQAVLSWTPREFTQVMKNLGMLQQAFLPGSQPVNGDVSADVQAVRFKNQYLRACFLGEKAALYLVLQDLDTQVAAQAQEVVTLYGVLMAPVAEAAAPAQVLTDEAIVTALANLAPAALGVLATNLKNLQDVVNSSVGDQQMRVEIQLQLANFPQSPSLEPLLKTRVNRFLEVLLPAGTLLPPGLTARIAQGLGGLNSAQLEHLCANLHTLVQWAEDVVQLAAISHLTREQKSDLVKGYLRRAERYGAQELAGKEGVQYFLAHAQRVIQVWELPSEGERVLTIEELASETSDELAGRIASAQVTQELLHAIQRSASPEEEAKPLFGGHSKDGGTGVISAEPPLAKTPTSCALKIKESFDALPAAIKAQLQPVYGDGTQLQALAQSMIEKLDKRYHAVLHDNYGAFLECIQQNSRTQPDKCRDAFLYIAALGSKRLKELSDPKHAQNAKAAKRELRRWEILHAWERYKTNAEQFGAALGRAMFGREYLFPEPRAVGEWLILFSKENSDIDVRFEAIKGALEGVKGDGAVLGALGGGGWDGLEGTLSTVVQGFVNARNSAGIDVLPETASESASLLPPQQAVQELKELLTNFHKSLARGKSDKPPTQDMALIGLLIINLREYYLSTQASNRDPRKLFLEGEQLCFYLKAAWRGMENRAQQTAVQPYCDYITQHWCDRGKQPLVQKWVEKEPGRWSGHPALPDFSVWQTAQTRAAAGGAAGEEKTSAQRARWAQKGQAAPAGGAAAKHLTAVLHRSGSTEAVGGSSRDLSGLAVLEDTGAHPKASTNGRGRAQSNLGLEKMHSADDAGPQRRASADGYDRSGRLTRTGSDRVAGRERRPQTLDPNVAIVIQHQEEVKAIAEEDRAALQPGHRPTRATRTASLQAVVASPGIQAPTVPVAPITAEFTEPQRSSSLGPSLPVQMDSGVGGASGNPTMKTHARAMSEALSALNDARLTALYSGRDYQELADRMIGGLSLSKEEGAVIRQNYQTFVAFIQDTSHTPAHRLKAFEEIAVLSNDRKQLKSSLLDPDFANRVLAKFLADEHEAQASALAQMLKQASQEVLAPESPKPDADGAAESKASPIESASPLSMPVIEYLQAKLRKFARTEGGGEIDEAKKLLNVLYPKPGQDSQIKRFLKGNQFLFYLDHAIQGLEGDEHQHLQRLYQIIVANWSVGLALREGLGHSFGNRAHRAFSQARAIPVALGKSHETEKPQLHSQAAAGAGAAFIPSQPTGKKRRSSSVDRMRDFVPKLTPARKEEISRQVAAHRSNTVSGAAAPAVLRVTDNGVHAFNPMPVSSPELQAVRMARQIPEMLAKIQEECSKKVVKKEDFEQMLVVYVKMINDQKYRNDFLNAVERARNTLPIQDCSFDEKGTIIKSIRDRLETDLKCVAPSSRRRSSVSVPVVSLVSPTAEEEKAAQAAPTTPAPSAVAALAAIGTAREDGKRQPIDFLSPIREMTVEQCELVDEAAMEAVDALARPDESGFIAEDEAEEIEPKNLFGAEPTAGAGAPEVVVEALVPESSEQEFCRLYGDLERLCGEASVAAELQKFAEPHIHSRKRDVAKINEPFFAAHVQQLVIEYRRPHTETGVSQPERFFHTFLLKLRAKLGDALSSERYQPFPTPDKKRAAYIDILKKSIGINLDFAKEMMKGLVKQKELQAEKKRREAEAAATAEAGQIAANTTATVAITGAAEAPDTGDAVPLVAVDAELVGAGALTHTMASRLAARAHQDVSHLSPGLGDALAQIGRKIDSTVARLIETKTAPATPPIAPVPVHPSGVEVATPGSAASTATLDLGPTPSPTRELDQSNDSIGLESPPPVASARRPGQVPCGSPVSVDNNAVLKFDEAAVATGSNEGTEAVRKEGGAGFRSSRINSHDRKEVQRRVHEIQLERAEARARKESEMERVKTAAAKKLDAKLKGLKEAKEVHTEAQLPQNFSYRADAAALLQQAKQELEEALREATAAYVSAAELQRARTELIPETGGAITQGAERGTKTDAADKVLTAIPPRLNNMDRNSSTNSSMEGEFPTISQLTPMPGDDDDVKVPHSEVPRKEGRSTSAQRGGGRAGASARAISVGGADASSRARGGRTRSMLTEAEWAEVYSAEAGHTPFGLEDREGLGRSASAASKDSAETGVTMNTVATARTVVPLGEKPLVPPPSRWAIGMGARTPAVEGRSPLQSAGPDAVAEVRRRESTSGRPDNVPPRPESTTPFRESGATAPSPVVGGVSPTIHNPVHVASDAVRERRDSIGSSPANGVSAGPLERQVSTGSLSGAGLSARHRPTISPTPSPVGATTAIAAITGAAGAPLAGQPRRNRADRSWIKK